MYDKRAFIALNKDEVYAALRQLKANDILQTGVETPSTFDADRAIRLLDKLYSPEVIVPIPCKDCEHRTEGHQTNVNHKGQGYFVYGCEKLSEYLGDNGYCSLANEK